MAGGHGAGELIKVGRNMKHRSGGYRRDFDTDVEVDATFDPETPPHIKGAPAGRESEFKPYADVKAHYDTLDAGVKKVLAESPAVFAIVSGGEAGAAADFAKQDTGKARAQLGVAMTKLGREDRRGGAARRQTTSTTATSSRSTSSCWPRPFAGELEKAIIDA